MATKSLTQSERKAVTELLEADFDNLRRDLHDMATDAQSAAADTVREDHKARTAKAQRYEDQMTALLRKVQDDGFRVGDRYGHSVNFSVEDKTLEDDINEAQRSVNAQLNQALSILRKKEHEAKTNLLKATLSQDAIALLETLPKAEDLMRQATLEAADRKANYINEDRPMIQDRSQARRRR